ncbi:M16 family metallopeptidase [Parasphingorhabdus cellanae]|uniref:Insulinase family protein n=1 Tax=Parasphingorhabdus cellanae TaxID=2806553 RepID=A0ABX7T559_9SPHN|nr:insulinase family protein [Parasphingorhabdus cellanae]QTD55897.1 insulinase family protein [Parasphingorhabdus cellanae]
MRQIFRLRFSLALVVIGMLFAGLSDVAVAQQQRGFAHEGSDLKPDPRVVYGTLDNGLRYAVMKNSTPSGVAALRMRIATGSLNETEKQLGIAHFLEHMAFNGSKNVAEGEMVKRLERYGLAFGADTNASTGFSQTTYKLNLPTVGEDILNEAFFLMRETAQNLTLDRKAIARERGVIAAEKRSRDSVNFRALVANMGFLTEGSGLVDRLPIGTDETIASMPRSEFVKYYRAFYRPENTFIVFVGDLDEDVAIKKIETYFGNWRSSAAPVPAAVIPPANVAPGQIGYHHNDEILTFVSLGVKHPYINRPDNMARRKEGFLRGLGAQIVNRRLDRKIDAGDAAYLNASISRYAPEDTVDAWIIRMRSNPDNWREALAGGDQEVRRAFTYGFSQDEMDEVLARWRKGLQVAVNRKDTRKTYGTVEYNYATELVDRFAKERVFTSPEADLERFEKFVAEVTLEDVERVFRERWTGIENPFVYLATNKKLSNPEAEIRAALDAAREIAVSPLEKEPAQKFAYTDFGKPGLVARETYLPDANAYTVTFANNVRLNFKQTDFDADTIGIRVRVGSGFLSMPQKNESLRRLAENLLNGSGVQGHSSDELRTLFAGKRVGTRVRLRPDNDALEIIGGTNRENLADQLNLMTAHVTAPAYRAQTVTRYHDKMKAWYPTHDATPMTVAEKELPRMIRSGDARYGYDDLDSFLAPEIQDVRDWMGPQLKDGLIEITIVGDVERAAAIAEVARTFGALPKRADSKDAFSDMRQLDFPTPPEAPFTYYHQGNTDQAVVRVYWPAPDASDAVNVFRMQVLRSIFRNRLSNVLREEMGATYSPGAGLFANDLFEDYGYIFASVTAAPEKVEEVHQAVLKVGENLAEGTIDQDIFGRAIKPIIDDIDSTQENNSYWMSVLGDAQTEGHGIARHRLREEVLTTMTVEDVNALAAEVFISDKAVAGYILPTSDDDIPTDIVEVIDSDL